MSPCAVLDGFLEKSQQKGERKIKSTFLLLKIRGAASYPTKFMGGRDFYDTVNYIFLFSQKFAMNSLINFAGYLAAPVKIFTHKMLFFNSWEF